MNAAAHEPLHRRPWSIRVTQSPGADDVIDHQYFMMGRTGVRLPAESCLIRALCHNPGTGSGILPDGLPAKTEPQTLPGTRRREKHPPSSRLPVAFGLPHAVIQADDSSCRAPT